MPRKKKEATTNEATPQQKPAKKTRAKRGPYGQQAIKRIAFALKALRADSEHLKTKLPHFAIASDLARAAKEAGEAWELFHKGHADDILKVEKPRGRAVGAVASVGSIVKLVGPNLAQAAILHGKDVAAGPWEVVSAHSDGLFLVLRSRLAASVTTAIPARSATPDEARAKAAQASVLSKLQ